MLWNNPTRLSILPWMLCLATGLPVMAGTEPDPWIDPAWRSRLRISAMGNGLGPQSDFPCLVVLSNCRSLSGARADGADLTFAGVDGRQLFHEVERFDRTNGNLVAWVCLPTFTNQTMVYLYFSNQGGTFAFNGSNTTLSLATNLTNLRDAFIRSNTWNDGYEQVWHFAETSGPFRDSSRSGYGSLSVDANIQAGAAGVAGTGVYSTGLGGKSGVLLPASSGIRGRTNSVTFWFQQGSPLPYQTNTSLLQHDPNYGFYFRITNQSAGRVAFNKSVTAGTYPYDGTWQWRAATHHLAEAGAGSNGATNYATCYFTNGASCGQNNGTTWVSPTAATNPVYFLGATFTGGGYSGVPIGLADEIRISRVIRSTNWLLLEYSNHQNALSGYALQDAEHNDKPRLRSPTQGYTTNYRGSFEWNTAVYDGALLSYDLCLMTDAGWRTNLPALLATNMTVDLGSLLGLRASNTLSWWVEASTVTGNRHLSLTNAFVCRFSPKARLRGMVRVSGRGPASSSLVQVDAPTNGFVFCDRDGRFDLGVLDGGTGLTLRITPTGSLGAGPLVTNLTLPDADVDLDLNLSPLATPDASASTTTATSTVVSTLQPDLRLALPANWSREGITTVTLTPLAGGARLALWEGVAGDGSLLVPMSAPLRLAPAGLHVLEVRLARLGLDSGSDRIFRRMVLLVK